MTSIEIKFYESKVNLNWKNIIKSIKEDPEGFVESGGWNFLDADQSDSEGEDGEEESDFAPRLVLKVILTLVPYCLFLINTHANCSDAEDEAESEEESSEDESLVESEDDESEFEVDSDEEAGMDWDELEEQARRDDKSREFSDDDEETTRKRKHGGSSSGAAKKSRR